MKGSKEEEPQVAEIKPEVSKKKEVLNHKCKLLCWAA